MKKGYLIFTILTALIFNSCDDGGDTKQYLQLGNKTNKEVVVEYQYSEKELRIIKIPAKQSSFIWYVNYALPDYTPDNSSIETELSKMTIYQFSTNDTSYLSKDEYVSVSKWIRSTSQDMSTTSVFYTLFVDSAMFVNQ